MYSYPLSVFKIRLSFYCWVASVLYIFRIYKVWIYKILASELFLFNLQKNHLEKYIVAAWIFQKQMLRQNLECKVFIRDRTSTNLAASSGANSACQASPASGWNGWAFVSPLGSVSSWGSVNLGKAWPWVRQCFASEADSWVVNSLGLFAECTPCYWAASSPWRGMVGAESGSS